MGLSGTFAQALPTTYSVRALNACAQTRIGHEVMIGRTQTSCLLKMLEYLKKNIGSFIARWGYFFPRDNQLVFFGFFTTTDFKKMQKTQDS